MSGMEEETRKETFQSHQKRRIAESQYNELVGDKPILEAR